METFMYRMCQLRTAALRVLLTVNTAVAAVTITGGVVDETGNPVAGAARHGIAHAGVKHTTRHQTSGIGVMPKSVFKD
jgi:hypothetical protein